MVKKDMVGKKKCRHDKPAGDCEYCKAESESYNEFSKDEFDD